MTRLEQIRENERRSHEDVYRNHTLYESGSWLQKPVKTVTELLPCFEKASEFCALDLGCGVGRNCIAIARHFTHIPCWIDCVDILPIAIEKLNLNASAYGVSQSINGIVSPLEDFSISENSYDLVLAVSALEHIDSRDAFLHKLEEIRSGIRENGIVCLIINSGVQEFNKLTGTPLPPQFEVNLPTEELQKILSQAFFGWKVLKSGVQRQRYEIPRGDLFSDLSSNVVTFVARNGLEA